MPSTRDRKNTNARALQRARKKDPWHGLGRGTLAPDAPRDVPRPIGKARLKALRDAIRSGAYPSEADVAGGLARMLGLRSRG